MAATKTRAEQIAELMTRRDELHTSMVLSHSRTDSAWFRDRAREMEHINLSLSRLHVRAAAAG